MHSSQQLPVYKVASNLKCKIVKYQRDICFFLLKKALLKLLILIKNKCLFDIYYFTSTTAIISLFASEFSSKESNAIKTIHL